MSTNNEKKLQNRFELVAYGTYMWPPVYPLPAVFKDVATDGYLVVGTVQPEALRDPTVAHMTGGSSHAGAVYVSKAVLMKLASQLLDMK